MKAPHNLYGKKLLSLPILLMVIFSALNVNITRVSAVEYPAIMVVPESTVDLTPGENFTVSIYTDYNGTNKLPKDYPEQYYIAQYQFALYYNPSVLQGVEVVNGDLIVGGSAQFIAGPFDNVAGELSLTVGYYEIEEEVTPGPGTLANVTFTVVDHGASPITIGNTTKLIGWDLFRIFDGLPPDYNIIDAALNSTHIQHGYFDNRFTHDVAVVNVTAPATAVVNSSMSIGVEVANIGKSDETVNVTVSYDGSYIDSENVTLVSGNSTTVSFDWNTTDVVKGTYIINATATILGDGDPTDNWKTTIFLVVHDVSVTSVTAPTTAPVGSLVSISVEVANEGSFAELVNVTIRYDSTLIGVNDTVVLPAQNSMIFPFDWNTTDVVKGTYIINATATILGDGDPTDNWKTTTTSLVAHDVAVVSVTAPAKAVVGSLVSISVEVANKGAFYETVNVTVSYDGSYIDSENVTLLVGESETVLFSLNTTGMTEGTYTINATATVAVDDAPTDNWKTTTTLLAVHDVAVTSISVYIDSVPAPYVYIGENVTITVLVINTGGYNETFEIVVSYDGTYIDSENVTLASYPSPAESLSFTWNTTGVDPASYTINATATILGDADPTDNWKATTIDVESPPGTIAGTVADASTGLPIAGANVTANGDYTTTTDADGYYNITDVPPGTYDVTVSAAKYISQSKTATVTADTPTTLDFTLTPLNGTISGTVTDSSTGDPISGANVTANGVSVSTDADGSYSIELAPGTYDLTVSADGYESSSETNITVIAGEPTTVDFELTPVQPPQPLNLLLYAGAAAIAIITTAAIAVYIIKVRKTKPA